jgi:hypothetical protein
VDTADYVLWRKGLGSTYSQNDYNLWRNNFGATAGTGSGTALGGKTSGSQNAVPEPSSLALLIVCFVATKSIRRLCENARTANEL